MIEVFKISKLSEARAIKCLPYDEYTYPYPIRLTYILQCTTNPNLIKVGSSYDLYERVKTINRQTQKWANLSFELKYVIRSNPVLENAFKSELRNNKHPLNSKIDGSEEFYDISGYAWKRLSTLVRKVVSIQQHT
ncbi:GIY-YIG nuclease family protein [Vibrio fluvialis]|nr:GIY-YIG nuclease family protein [Vibrio fluvialis]